MTIFVRMFTFLTLLPAIAFASDIPAEVSKMAQEFNLSMNTCPQKVWQNYNWKDTVIIMIYKKAKKSYIWSGSDNSVVEYSFSNIPDSAVKSDYKFFKLNGVTAMSLRMNEEDTESSQSIFRLGVHEFFHHIAQNDWSSSNLTGVRGTSYPLEWQARYFRRMLFDSLKMALRTNSEIFFKEAKYWYNRWKTDFPTELSASTDGYEGSAEYAETIGQAIANKGCEVSDEALKLEVIRLVEADFGKTVTGQVFALDSEGYEIGGLATILLRFKHGSSNWQKQIAQGVSPLEVLLSSYSIDSHTENESIKQKFQAIATEKNQKTGKYLDTDLLNFSKVNFVRVSVPFDWNQTNLRPRFFSVPTALESTTAFPLGLGHHFISPEGTSNLNLKEDAVVFMNFVDNPCFQPYTLVEKSKITTTGNLHLITSQKVNGTFKGDFKSNGENYEFLCPSK